jgi:hypothetical protein
MIITRKRIDFPIEINFDGISIKVVKQFKLLGIIIDDKMLFSKYIASICLKVNYKLYSIKKLFYLSTSVKVQFFKAFILPYFDYCLSLSIYYSKSVVQKLCNCYNMCLVKLFNSTKNDKFIFNDEDDDKLIKINNFLKKFNIFSFTHRIFIRLNLFLFKIVTNESPPLLNSYLKKEDNQYMFKLRSFNSQCLKETNSTLHYGDLTFKHFFSEFYNKFLVYNTSLSLKQFKKYIFINLDNLVNDFVKNFIKFNLNFFFCKNFLKR